MKRCIVILLALLLLAACGGREQAPDREPSSSRSQNELVSGGGSLPDQQPQGDLSEELPAIAADSAESGEAAEPQPDPVDPPEQTPSRTDRRLDEAALTAHARTLTEHIAFTVFESKEIRNGDRPPQEKDMELFTIGVSYYRDRQGYWYHDVAVRDEDLYYHFPEERIKSMVYEVFGFENWLLEKNEDPYAYPLSYHAEEKEFYGGLEFGFGTFMECDFKDTVVDIQNMRVTVDYDLYTTSLFPNQEKIGAAVTDYSIRFLEDGSPYLRYEGTVITPSQQ